jgi:hypothetical protein
MTIERRERLVGFIFEEIRRPSRINRLLPREETRAYMRRRSPS